MSLHPVCAARADDKRLPGLLCGLLGEIVALQAAVVCVCPCEAFANHRPASSRMDTQAFAKPFPFPPTFKGRGWLGVQGAEPARPGQVLCVLLWPLCQRKHKHPTQRKHFSSAAQVPIFAQSRSVLGSFPHRTAGLSEHPAEPSGLGCSQSHPPHPALDPPKPVNVTTSRTWRGLTPA